MGEYPKPTYAYMIPLDEHGVFSNGDPYLMDLIVYKIPANGVARFRKAFPTIKWGVLYSLYDMTNLSIFKELDDAETSKRKK